LLVAERKARSLPQEELARRLRQHQSMIARIEGGKRRSTWLNSSRSPEAIGFDPTNILRQIQPVAGERRLGRVRRVKVAS
jgi:hypothetical protein